MTRPIRFHGSVRIQRAGRRTCKAWLVRDRWRERNNEIAQNEHEDATPNQTEDERHCVSLVRPDRGDTNNRTQADNHCEAVRSGIIRKVVCKRIGLPQSIARLMRLGKDARRELAGASAHLRRRWQLPKGARTAGCRGQSHRTGRHR